MSALWQYVFSFKKFSNHSLKVTVHPNHAMPRAGSDITLRPQLNYKPYLVMKKIFVLTGLVAAMCFTACKKDKGDDPAPGNGGEVPTPAPAKLLKKFTRTENGVNTVFNVTYDDKKRLSSIISSTNHEKTIFSYDNAGNLTQVDETEEKFRNIYTYTYNAAGPATGKLKSWKLTGTQTSELIEDDELIYTVANGQVTKIHLNMILGDMQEDFDLTYTNGQVTKIASGPSQYPYTANFTYGTKKPVFPSVTKWVLDQAGFSVQFGAKTEVTSLKFDFPGDVVDKTINLQYTFDSNGYVLTSTDGKASIKYEYE